MVMRGFGLFEFAGRRTKLLGLKATLLPGTPFYMASDEKKLSWAVDAIDAVENILDLIEKRADSGEWDDAMVEAGLMQYDEKFIRLEQAMAGVVQASADATEANIKEAAANLKKAAEEAMGPWLTFLKYLPWIVAGVATIGVFALARYNVVQIPFLSPRPSR